MKIKYKIGTEENSTEVNSWEFFEACGLIKEFENDGIIITPTHDFELMKKARKIIYEIAKQKFIEERNLNRIETNDLEHNLFKVAWLNSELLFVEKKQPKETTSNQIEIAKYKQFVEMEIENIKLKINPPQQIESKNEQIQPTTFAELFYKPEHAEPCLKILNELQPTFIDSINNFIGKGKGIFPLWVKVLKNHKPQPLIKHFKDTVYKDLLNQKVKGLNLTKDASEFRKHYKRLEKDKIELDIKTILSQYSQSGKLGK